jgi:hypothetical protein
MLGISMTQSNLPNRCAHCGAAVPQAFESCKAMFDHVCSLEYGDRAFGATHLLTVDAYVLQHSAVHGPRSNAFHLMRLCRIVEHGDNPAIGQRPSRNAMKAFEKRYPSLPYLVPPSDPGRLTIADVIGAAGPEEHTARVMSFAKAVWDAWAQHHAWARQQKEVVLELGHERHAATRRGL